VHGNLKKRQLSHSAVVLLNEISDIDLEEQKIKLLVSVCFHRSGAVSTWLKVPLVAN
jgi:hypothetical protein